MMNMLVTTRFLRPALQFIALFLFVFSMIAMVKPAHAADPPAVAPYPGQLTYYGTDNGYLCYTNGLPTGSDEKSVALAAAKMYRYPTVGFAKLGSDIYDGKRNGWYRENPQTLFPSYPVSAVTQYVCLEGSNNPSSPAYNCSGMPNARNNPNECCPCGYFYDSGKSLCVLMSPKPAACPTVCPANMSGPPCVCKPGYVPNPAGAGCFQEQYIISEPQDQAQLPDMEPGSSRGSSVKVVSALTGLPKQGAVVKIHLGVDISSGGHDHGETYGRRSRGSITGCASEPGGAGGTADSYLCTTGTDGYAGFTFNAPDASGKHTITATCISSLCSGSKTAKINVKVDGLATIPGSPFYTFIGDTGKHKDNHYLAPEAASVLWRMAAGYRMEAKYRQLRILRMWRRSWVFFEPPLPLQVNDASLIWGGRFDTKGNWATPHAMHRRGVVIDVRANSNTGAIPLASFSNFQDMAASYKNAINGKRAEAQVHCTKRDGQDRQPPSCIGRDGSQDSNRHMHILLLGVDQ